MIRFRTCNHRLPVETGRYINILKCNRKCNLCDLDDIGDEFHYFCLCPKFHNARKSIFGDDLNLLKKPSVFKFCNLFKTLNDNRELLYQIAKLSKHIIMNVDALNA